jgi:long-chain acyl-CoA synthetase
MSRTHLASLVEDFRRHGSQTAIVEHRGNRRFATSYADLANLAGRFSAELSRRQVLPGERVVIWGANSAEWIAAFFGCLLRGVLAVPLDSSGTSEFAARVIADVDPRLIVGDRGLLSTLAIECPTLPFSEFQNALPLDPLFEVEPAVSPQLPMQIIFTSGTTSEPKGVVHTHRNVLAGVGPIESEIEKYRKYERFVHPLRFLHSLPLSHVFGQFMGLWVPALLAAEVHFESQLEPARLIETVRSERISLLAAVPRVLDLLRIHLMSKDATLTDALKSAQGESIWLRWWRFRKLHRAFGFKFWAFVCGGASLPEELEQFWNTAGFALIQGYGLTETAALVTLNHPFRIGRGTIGQPLPGREIMIRDDGEIMVRGEMLSTASWQGGRMQSREQDWLATGDLVAKDAAGHLQFKGRKGDVIVLASGMNIYPADVEGALFKQPGVRDCAVIGWQGPLGVEPVAVIVSSNNEEELQSAIRAANSGLAQYQQIRRWLRWPQLEFPRTSTGKVLRREISQWAESVLSQTAPSPASAHNEDPVTELITRITGENAFAATDNSLLSEDLHLDSLGRVQLQSAIEQKLGMELPAESLEQAKTLGELKEIILRAAGGFAPDPATAVEPPSAPQRQTAPASATQAQERDVYSRWPWSLPVLALRVLFLEAVIRPLTCLLANPRVVSSSQFLSESPVLIIANHVTALDGALVLYSLPARVRRRTAIAMSGEMLLDMRAGRNQKSWLLNALAPIEYWLLTALFNVFPLPRHTGFRASFSHAGVAMDRGYSVLVFPEGRRSTTSELQPFRAGIGLLAQQSQAAVLPVALIGLGNIKAGHSKWFRSGKLTVKVGDTIPYDAGKEPAELTHTFEIAMHQLARKEV